MKKLSGIIAVAAVALLASCGGGKYEYAFQNPKLKVDKRVDNLMSLLTPEEKVGLIMNKSVSVSLLERRMVGIVFLEWASSAFNSLMSSRSSGESIRNASMIISLIRLRWLVFRQSLS